MRRPTRLAVLGLLLLLSGVASAKSDPMAALHVATHLNPFNTPNSFFTWNLDFLRASDRGGTELGSGREFLRRLSEQYGLGMSDTLERYLVDRIGRIVPPLFRGGPNQWQVGVDDNVDFHSVRSEVMNKIDRGWQPIFLGRYPGIKWEGLSNDGQEVIQTQFLHGNNFVEIEVNGKPASPSPTTFEQFRRSLGALPVMN